MIILALATVLMLKYSRDHAIYTDRTERKATMFFPPVTKS